MRVCGTLPETLTLLQTNLCDFPYPISDLIKNLIPYFSPALQSVLWVIPMLKAMFICFYEVGYKTVQSFEIKIPYYKAGCIMPRNKYRIRAYTNHTLFQTKMAKIHTLFQTKTAKKTVPFGAPQTYIAYIREYPPLPGYTQRVVIVLVPMARIFLADVG